MPAMRKITSIAEIRKIESEHASNRGHVMSKAEYRLCSDYQTARWERNQK